MVDICLLGCGGGMPMPFRNLSATLINYKGRKILIDCGEGTQVSMRIICCGFKSIDVICITHGHGDHIVGLPGLLSTIGNSGRTAPLTIIGPEGITDIVNGLRVIAQYLPYEVNIIENPSLVEFDISDDGLYVSGQMFYEEKVCLEEVGKDKVRKLKDNFSNDKVGNNSIEEYKMGQIRGRNGQLTINTLELDHSSPCLGYSLNFKRERKFNVKKAVENNVPKVLWSRLQKEERATFEGKEYNGDMVLGDERRGIKVSLVTDSRPLDIIPKFIEDSELFICEGTYGKGEDVDKAIKNKHMTYREAAGLAKEGRVRALLLTHFSPAMLEPNEFINNAKDVFENTLIGEDRMKMTLCFRDE